MVDVSTAVEREIVEVHDFFEAWYLGADGDLERLEAAFAPDMTFVGPTGTEVDRGGVIEWIRSGHGHSSSLKILISDVRVLAVDGATVTARYVETHELADRSNHRISTVVFRRSDAAPYGLSWVAVHETWLNPVGG